MLCKRCKHEQYSHHGGYGKCYVILTEREGEWYEVTIGPGIRAWTQDIEYGDECPCMVMITWMPSSSNNNNKNSSNKEKKSNLDHYL